MNTTDAPILARMVPLSLADLSAAPAEIMAFPAGLHTIHATQADKPITKDVMVGPDAATAMNSALQAHIAAGQRPYFDFDHDDTKASAWPKSYRWEAGSSGVPAGVYASVDWSGSGAAAVLGKDYRSFSPAFLVDKAKPARVVGAPLNMGGLVNAPAFRRQAPIWAKQSASSPFPPTQTMSTDNQTPEQLAAAEALKAKEALAASQNELATLKAKDAARRKADAVALVATAVARGALPPKDEAIQAKWTSLIEADPSHAQLLATLPGNDLTKPVTSAGHDIVIKASASDVLKAYGAAKTAQDRAAIYAKDVRVLLDDKNFTLGPILAANSLGTLAGELALQRSLTLLKRTYPWLFKLSTDFSAENAAFGQVVKTRLKSALVANEYDPATGYGDNNATTVDVPVTINHNIGVPVTFTVNELASTSRDLFGEQVEGMHSAIADAVVAALFALILNANFANSTASKLSEFTRAVPRAMSKAMTGRKVGKTGRWMLLNSDFHEKLGQDTSIVQLSAFQRPEIITEMDLPRVAAFDPYEAETLPVNGEALAGFGGNSETFAMATRVPNDYTQALAGSSNGSVSAVLNPDTGITVQKVDYVNHTLASATSRVALMFGVAPGNKATGQRLTKTAEA